MQLVPVGNGLMVVRVPTLRPNEKMSQWNNQVVTLTVSDAMGNTLVRRSLLRGVDTIVPTPCWSQDCRPRQTLALS